MCQCSWKYLSKSKYLIIVMVLVQMSLKPTLTNIALELTNKIKRLYHLTLDTVSFIFLFILIKRIKE